ncbi:alpha/beta hydrolase [Paenibacillus apiarius]|uniref:Alpha/beta hydrolase n=1 Tax=Paenibacillus apiarius TaxID=46240 RepID=A0ABT4DQG4_9BACL|nr:alpha/beta hydrolase [Paenibacillus apiarius]MCY9513953.1 alpha/beta hydrolase [Paenibacillus apiarius]MCY9519470.1 alpha/beta hydrolase [Paenibacillus apiarius]MCY9552397.1 alpha/beta hydrolase [Paenibacillus apiarius]MCY9556225.1 alpha/beta hydrolase [Paenibacillus apiarius]MCY9681760.1 alpha/beta hydrolase [Paenibacillus apiarius]
MPGIVFIHGGGFIGGTLDVVEHPCKALAEKANGVVVSVDYRLEPEHPYPAGLHDCFDTVRWAHQHADEQNMNRDQLAIAGDSAGGNLSTVCAMMDRDLGTGMIKFEALIYPTVNMGNVATDDYKWDIAQYTINNHHDLIMAGIQGLGNMSGILDRLYLQGRAEVANPYVSPLLADDLSGMPETLIITAEYDFLRLECEAYARKLLRSGVNTRLIQYNGMDHAFMDKLGSYPQAEDCMSEIAQGVPRAFS